MVPFMTHVYVMIRITYTGKSPTGLEPAIFGAENQRVIQLRYRDMCADKSLT